MVQVHGGQIHVRRICQSSCHWNIFTASTKILTVTSQNMTHPTARSMLEWGAKIVHGNTHKVQLKSAHIVWHKGAHNHHHGVTELLNMTDNNAMMQIIGMAVRGAEDWLEVEIELV